MPHHPVSLRYLLTTVLHQGFTKSQLYTVSKFGVLRGTQILLREEEAAGQAGDTLQVHVGLKCRIIWIQR